MRILTAAGTTDVGDTRYLPSFSKKDVQAEAQRHCGTQISPYINDETFPGFLPPCSGDAIAVIIAESTYSIPYLWLSTVIDKYYDQGLRFLVKCHDPLNLNADGKAYSDVLYSVPSDAAPTKYSQHCVCLTDRGVMQDGDYDEDLYLPMIDDEGNELTSPTHSLL